MQWYEQAFNADQRDETLAKDSVEVFGQRYEREKELASQPTSLEESLRLARELGRIPDHDCGHSSHGEDGCDCDLLREKLELEAWKDKV